MLSFAASRERYADLLETEGVLPAPYLARAHWVAIRHWRVFRRQEMEENLAFGHALIHKKLPRKTRELLALPAAAQRKLLRERKKLLADRAATAS